MKRVIFQMESLTCPSCIKKIEQSLGKQQGVGTAKVLFHSGKVKVEYDEKVITAGEMEAMLVKLGYPVLSKKVA